MRLALMLSTIGLCMGVAGAQAGTYVKGNDTGGIISWSCESEALAREIAAEHCGRWAKYPRITSVHRQYGDYIAFQCLWNPRLARTSIPPARVRSACAHPRYAPRVRVLY